MGLQLLGVASIAASLNFIVTIINLRAPGTGKALGLARLAENPSARPGD